MAVSTAQDHIEQAQDYLRYAAEHVDADRPDMASASVACAVEEAGKALVDMNARLARLEEAVKALSWGKADA